MAKLFHDIQSNVATDTISVAKLRNNTSKSYIKSKEWSNRLFVYACWISAFFVCATLAAIVFFVGKTGLLVFRDVPLSAYFLSLDWEPFAESYGAALFILGTLALTALTLLIATPIALIVATFIAEIAPSWLKKIMRPTLDLLVGIPSIVYGYLGITILVPFIRESTGTLVGDGLLAASLVLAIMILPTITRISDDAITFVPREYKEAAYALGSTRFQTITRVVLPAAKRGIMTAIVLGMARAIGETMAVVMVIGNTPQLAKDLFTPTSVLTSNIVMQITNVQFGSTWSHALYMMAFILLLISMLLILLIKVLARKGEIYR